MPARRRAKNGGASLASIAGIDVFILRMAKVVDGGHDKPRLTPRRAVP
jgi:hypothetical protein